VTSILATIALSSFLVGAPAVRTISRTPTAEQRETYLAALREGHPHQRAATMAGETGSAFRAFRRRDGTFRAEVDAALADGAEAFGEAAHGEVVRRVEERSISDRELVRLATAFEPLPQYARLRPVAWGGNAEASGEFPIPQVEMARFTTAQLEELDRVAARFWELIAIGQGRAPNPELDALEASEEDQAGAA
jgi:hypothetical protein